MKLHKPPFLLKEIKLEVTHACPLACAHCSSDASSSCTREMTVKDCLRIISEAADMGVKELAFSGGEPLIWRGLADAICLSVGRGIKTIVYTSGNVPNQQKILKAIADIGVKRCVFSLFAASEQAHEQITRIRGSFSRTLRAITLAKKAGMETEIHFVPIVDNFEQLSEIAILSKKRGAARVSILRFVPQGRGQLIASHTLNRFQNLQLRRTIEDLRSTGYDIRTGSPYNFLMLNNKPECRSGIDRLIVGPGLHIYPCDAFKQVKAEEVVGTLDYSCLDRWELSECWESSPFLKQVRAYLTTDFEPPCDTCKLLASCLSGCLAQKVIAHGDFGKRPDPACLHTGG